MFKVSCLTRIFSQKRVKYNNKNCIVIVARLIGDVGSMSYSQEISVVIFSNETAVLGCSIFVLKTMLGKTLTVQSKTGASMGILLEIFQ